MSASAVSGPAPFPLPSGGVAALIPAAPAPAPAATASHDLVISPCAGMHSLICDVVYQHTHQAWLADVAKVTITRPLPIVAIVVASVLLRWVLHRVIDRTVLRATSEPGPTWRRLGPRARRALADFVPGSGERRTQRAKTLGSVLRSISSVVLYTTAAVMTLGQLGVNLAPLLASASIIGVALGFGAQSLVKDVLSGAFALFEDQYGVGDVISVDGTSGVVEAVGLRSTRVRDVHGAVWHVRNGEITKLGNFSQQWARALLDIGVSYDSDIDATVAVIGQVAQSLADDDAFADLVLAAPEVWGVEDCGPHAITIRLVVKTVPLKQWDVARELRRRLRYAFAEHGIEIGTPRQLVQVSGPGAAMDPLARTWHDVTPRADRPGAPPRGVDRLDPADKLRP